MRALLLFALVTVVLCIPSSGTLAHLGRTIPLHIPTQTLTVNETFEVPAWLGAFYATVEVASTWTLPLTIGNGGQTYPGEFLIIRNYGPEGITLIPTSPETIEGGSGYAVPAGTIIEILSGYPNWVVTSVPNVDQNITAENLDIKCDLNVGNTSQSGTWGGCGTIRHSGAYLQGNLEEFVAQTTALGTKPTMARTLKATIENGGVVEYDGIWVPRDAPQHRVRREQTFFGTLGDTTAYVTPSPLVYDDHIVWQQDSDYGLGTVVGRQVSMYFTKVLTNRAINMVRITTFKPYTPGIPTGSTGTISTNTIIEAITPGLGSIPTGMTWTGTSGVGLYGADAGTMSSNVQNLWGYRCGGMSGAQKNYCYWVQSNTASCGAGFAAGTAGDTCQYRGAANRWTGDAGIDWYTETGHFCGGTGCAAMSATNVGLYDSAVRVVRSCTAGAGITCSVTDGVLTVSANANLQKTDSGIMPLGTPTSSNSPCTAGTYMSDASYLYICVATNTWRRLPSESF